MAEQVLPLLLLRLVFVPPVTPRWVLKIQWAVDGVHCTGGGSEEFDKIEQFGGPDCEEVSPSITQMCSEVGKLWVSGHYFTTEHEQGRRSSE